MSWVKYHIEHLRRWGEAVKAVVEATKSLGVNADIYVIGDAAEDRLPVLSDIDVLICLKTDTSPRERYELKKKILIKAIEDHNLPWDYPIELHVYNYDECKEILMHCGKHLNVTHWLEEKSLNS